MGYLLYLCRRVGHGIVLAIVVHWVWNSSTFSAELGHDDDTVLSDAAFAEVLLTFVLMIVVFLRRRSIALKPSVAANPVM